MTSTNDPARPGRCARPGCPNPLPRNRTGRPRIYCSRQCREATYRHRPLDARAPLQVQVDYEADDGDRGRPSGHVWRVQLRRGTRQTTIATGLGRPSAEHLARQIREVINPAPRRHSSPNEVEQHREPPRNYVNDQVGNSSNVDTRVTNRIRGLLTQIHPALERAIGSRLRHKAVLELLSRFGGPSGLRAAGRRRLTAVAKSKAPRIHTEIVDAILAALDEQTVLVPGTTAAETVLPKLADQLARLLAQRAQIASTVEDMLDAHPLAKVLTSMPGIAARTGARILLEVGDASAFPTPGHLAAYSGLAPVTRRSGTSIKGEHPNRAGNRKLKNAMFQAAFASLRDPDSRAYYDRKRAEKKKHNAATICLARRRCDVLYAMLRDKTLYRKPTRSAA